MDKTKFIVSEVYLLNLGNNEQTRVFDEMVIGRSEGELTFPADNMISRRHLRLEPSNEVVTIEDLGSTNHTRVNGKKLEAKTKYKLRSRDIIELGAQKLQIFIGGKIAEDGTSAPTNEFTRTFHRLTAVDIKLPDAKKKSDTELDFIDDYSHGGVVQVSSGKVNQSLLSELADTKGVSWYLQFEGSEFGPLSFAEVKTVVKSNKFQGGALFLWADGLPAWTPIDGENQIFKAKSLDISMTHEVESPVPLVAVVNWFDSDSNGGQKKVSANCEDISPREISVSYEENVSHEGPFDIEVVPRAGLGMSKFRMTVTKDPSRARASGHTFLIVSTPPQTKQLIEQYIKKHYE